MVGYDVLAYMQFFIEEGAAQLMEKNVRHISLFVFVMDT